MPSNNRVGSVIVLENDGAQRFTTHVLADRIARVADVEAGDLDGDGDLDSPSPVSATTMARRGWLENKGGWRFEQHVLLRLSGPINAVVTDLNHDGRPDIVALVSQEWEEIWAFVNDGRGRFTPQMIWGSTNADFGSSWISVADLDHDGDLDIVYSNGDAFDYAPPNSRPWHGVQWLENTGNLQFAFHRIADLPGRLEPAGGGYRRRRRSRRRRREREQRLGRSGRAEPRLAGERRPDAVHDARHRQLADASDHAGGRRSRRRRHARTSSPAGMHINRPFARMGRVTAWINHGPPAPR